MFRLSRVSEFLNYVLQKEMFIYCFYIIPPFNTLIFNYKKEGGIDEVIG